MAAVDWTAFDCKNRLIPNDAPGFLTLTVSLDSVYSHGCKHLVESELHFLAIKPIDQVTPAHHGLYNFGCFDLRFGELATKSVTHRLRGLFIEAQLASITN